MTKIRDLEQVVDAAARVFAEKGYEASRLEDIANELGVLQGSLYYHIKSKSDLLSLVQRRRLAEAADSIEAIARTTLPPGEKLRVVVTEHLRLIDRYFPESLQWFIRPSSPSAGLTIVDELHERYYRAWVSVVREGIDGGVLRANLDPSVVSRLMLGMCNWYTTWYTKGGKYTMDELIGMTLQFAFDGIANCEHQ